MSRVKSHGTPIRADSSISGLSNSINWTCPRFVPAVTAGNQPETESYTYTLNGSLDSEVNPDGSTTDYTYDDLNRLTDIDEYRKDSNTPNDFTDNPKLSEYSYTLRADGKKEFADEIIYDSNGTTPVSHTQFDWTYDNASRLTDEVFTDVGNLLTDVDNYHTSFEYDLTGNRLKQTTITDTSGDGLFDVVTDDDEVTTYESDANDRLKTENRTLNTQSVESTAYGYTSTQQSSKTVTDNSQISNPQISSQLFSYDLQGRMSAVVSTTFNPTTGTATRIDTIGYRYGTDGIRISARQEMDTNADGTIDSVENTEYLIDANNHTGYQQVLEETVTDANGDLIKKIVYTIGLDHISQTTFTPSGPAQGVTAVFHMDGHGSTRILTDLAGAILNVAGFAQIYYFTAYGEAINFQMANAATQYLYSGEQFDARIGQQYLRARYYNQANGTFNQRDPFFGNLNDPQSFHKYLYGHGDSVNNIDPTGLMSLGGMIGVGAARAGLGAVTGAAIGGIYGGIDARLGGGSFWAGFQNGAVVGALFGAAAGVLGPVFAAARAGTALARLGTGLAGLGVGLNTVGTLIGVIDSLYHGQYDQGVFRLGSGLMGFGFTQKIVGNMVRSLRSATSIRPLAAGVATSKTALYDYVRDIGDSGEWLIKAIEKSGVVVEYFQAAPRPGVRGTYNPVTKVIRLYGSSADNMKALTKTLFHEFLHHTIAGGRNKMSEFWAEFIPQVMVLGTNPLKAATDRIIQTLGVRSYETLPIFFNGDTGVGMTVMTYLQDYDEDE